MNRLFVFLLCIASPFAGSVFSQAAPKFKLTKDGVKPVVLTFDASFSANQIYSKVKEWVALTYKNSKAAIRVDKENSLVKVGGFKSKAWKVRDNNFDYWYDLEYTILIEIKEAKCRVTFETPDNKYKVWYNKDGTIISKFKNSEATFEATVNEFLTSLNTHIKEKPKKAVDNW
jgi:hypothetical protein